ncbi:MAG TPA: carboxypeptidase-like regulatory domain-containing protein, partial [Chthonomonadales bacterium]|nr:carboxypeptidase-like regulatory domain-containing protein [Chthonomonadales bacterium]
MASKNDSKRMAAKPAGMRGSARALAGASLVPLLALLVFAAAVPARAQLDTGSISGVVTDPAGRVVQGATITATQLDTKAVYTTESSSTGYFVFPALHTGSYQVRITASGFKTTVRTGVIVSIGTQTPQNVQLAVGSQTETVSVTAGAASLETTTSEIDDNISPAQVEDLPLQVTGNLRSITSMEFLVPGTVGPGTSSGGSGFQMTKINGGQEEGTDYLVDGITTNRMQNGSGSVDILTPSVEAVNEFHVSISGLPANLGR